MTDEAWSLLTNGKKSHSGLVAIPGRGLNGNIIPKSCPSILPLSLVLTSSKPGRHYCCSSTYLQSSLQDHPSFEKEPDHTPIPAHLISSKTLP
jgi:hypothetical protein